MLDLQKASMWKRISAWLFDLILLGILVVGAALLLSTVLGYDTHAAALEELYAGYEQSYGVKLNVTAEERAAFDAAQEAAYLAAREAMYTDVTWQQLYGLLIQYTVLITVFAILIAYLLLELLVPLLLGNGQTLGKKVFGIGVMRIDGVRLSAPLLFARTVLGKYTVETMIPVMILLMISLNPSYAVWLSLVGILVLVELALLIFTPARTPLHDKLAQTVTVDLASQMIFETYDELLVYRKKYNESKESGQL